MENAQSLTIFYELQKQNFENNTELLQPQIMVEPSSPEVVEPQVEAISPTLQILPQASRISGDLDFSDDEDYSRKLLEQDPEAKRRHDLAQVENIQAFLREDGNLLNQRSFNENDIMGRFERDWDGKIVDQDRTLRMMNYKDLDGNAVNE